jgi:hypothetical protein
MNLILKRTARSTACTQGVLTLPGGLNLQTLELTWLPNPDAPGGMPDLSCVPPGHYDLVLHDTPKHPRTFALVNPDLGVIHAPDPAYPAARVACLIHIANVPAELEGCVGLGMSATECEVSSSAAALQAFNSQVPWETGHTLEITDP